MILITELERKALEALIKIIGSQAFELLHNALLKQSNDTETLYGAGVQGNAAILLGEIGGIEEIEFLCACVKRDS